MGKLHLDLIGFPIVSKIIILLTIYRLDSMYSYQLTGITDWIL